MSNRAQAQYLRIYDESITYVRWQQYYVNQTITLDTALWTFNPFSADGIVDSSASGGNSISVTTPATTSAVNAFTAAMDNNRLCEIKIYEFDSRLGNTAPQSGQTLIAQFIGEVTSINGSFTGITIELGDSLSPVGAQVPPRKFTSYLIGTPLRI